MSVPKLAGLRGGQKPLDNKKELNQVSEAKEPKLGGFKGFGSKPELPKFKSKIGAPKEEEKPVEEVEEKKEEKETTPTNRIGKLKKEVKQIQEESKKTPDLKEGESDNDSKEESDAASPEENQSEEKKEEVVETKGKRSRKNKTTQNVPAAIKEDGEVVTNFNDAAQIIFSSFTDPVWDGHEEEIANKLNEIVITSDMNSATLKLAISDVDHLRSEIWLEHNQYKNMYIDLSCEKPDGLIERVKKLNMQGDNESARKSNAIYACENYIKDGSKINLFELLEVTRRRYFFLKSVMDSLDFKANSLITMSETLKNESRTLNV